MVWRRAAFVVIAAVWLAVVGVGMGRLWAYASTPGPSARASAQWPADTALRRDPARSTLVMFLHPECGCSVATVAELAVLMTQAQGRVRAHVLMFRPAGAPPGWERSSGLWADAAAIPGVEVTSDVDAAEAAHFGAFVSGQTLLYDRSGDLAFQGGVTFARGHRGVNDGRLALTALLTGGRPETRRTPVFGCLLRPAPAA